MHTLGLGRLSYHALQVSCWDQLGFALIPFGEDFRGRCTAQDARMDETRKTDAGNVPGGAKDAFKVPDGFCSVIEGINNDPPIGIDWLRPQNYSRFRIVLIQEPASIIFVKHARKSPRVVLERLYILNLDEQYVAWLGGLDFERSRQVVDLSEINVLHVVGAVIVADLATRPIQTFDLHNLAVLDGTAEGYWTRLVAVGAQVVPEIVPSGCHLFYNLIS
jgi:hypothetical protein